MGRQITRKLGIAQSKCILNHAQTGYFSYNSSKYKATQTNEQSLTINSMLDFFDIIYLEQAVLFAVTQPIQAKSVTLSFFARKIHPAILMQKFKRCFFLALFVCLFPLQFLAAKPLIVSVAPSYPVPVAQFINQVPEVKLKKLKTDEETPAPQTPATEEQVPNKDEAWQKVFNFISQETKLDLIFEPASSQLDFELKLAKSHYDLSLVTPLQFDAFRENPGYQALVKRKSQPIRSVIFVKKNSRIKTFADLRDAIIAFPNPLNFESSIVPRESLKRLKFNIVPQFLSSEAAVYQEVIRERYKAGAGTHENFRAQPIEIQNGLRIIWDSPGFSPHPFVAHPRVDFFSLVKLKRAFVDMIKDEQAKQLLPYIFVDNGFEVARNSDWDEIKLIDLNELNGSINNTQIQAE
jgi:ABC-type phosphate/phosphonate transport system substrate-binding protein